MSPPLSGWWCQKKYPYNWNPDNWEIPLNGIGILHLGIPQNTGIFISYIREFPIIEEYGTFFSVPVLLIYDNQGLPVVGK